MTVSWDPPAPGQWWFEREHMPRPVSRLFMELFEQAQRGWATGGLEYGMPPMVGNWALVNHWAYFQPGTVEADVDDLERRAQHTLATRRWRADIDHWREVRKPELVARSRALQAENLDALDDATLADHLRRAVEHLVDAGPTHFEGDTRTAAVGLFAQEAVAWGIGGDDVLDLLAGSSSESSATIGYLDGIADALAAAGVTEIRDLASIRHAGGDAAGALDRYLDRYGWHLLAGFDPLDPTVGERPDLIASSVRARLGARRVRQEPADPAPYRALVPDEHKAKFDELLADARLAYGLRDDDNGPCYMWPFGLVRRVVLAAGHRLMARGDVTRDEDLFEATSSEIIGLLTGVPSPTAAELAARADGRRAAASLDPPVMLGQPGPEEPPPAYGPTTLLFGQIQRGYNLTSTRRTSGSLGGLGIGNGTYRGRACVADTASEALATLQPGDVLITVMTTPTFNAVLPIAGAVAVATGGTMCHTAILARELRMPAVVGVADLLDMVQDGDLVEVDGDAGVVRVISGSRA